MEPKTLVGVRLTREELGVLERITASWNLKTRSDALRALLDHASTIPPPGVQPLELPSALRTELEDLVDDGWAGGLDSALTLAVSRGLSALSEDCKERGVTLRERAKELRTHRLARKEAALTGQKFLTDGEERR